MISSGEKLQVALRMNPHLKKRDAALRTLLLVLMCVALLPTLLFIFFLANTVNPFVVMEIHELQLVNKSDHDVRFTLIGTLPAATLDQRPGRKWILERYLTLVPAIPSFTSKDILLPKGESRQVYFHAEQIKPSEVWISYDSGESKFVPISSIPKSDGSIQSGRRPGFAEIVIPEASLLPNVTTEIAQAGSGRNIWTVHLICLGASVVFVLAFRRYLLLRRV
jgi:hypothetical protein